MARFIVTVVEDPVEVVDTAGYVDPIGFDENLIHRMVMRERIRANALLSPLPLRFLGRAALYGNSGGARHFDTDSVQDQVKIV